MVPYFRHLGKSDELIASLDVVEESLKVDEAITVDREILNYIVEFFRYLTKFNESITPLDTNEETKTSDKMVVNDINNSGHMVKCFRHLGMSDVLSTPLDMVEESVYLTGFDEIMTTLDLNEESKTSDRLVVNDINDCNNKLQCF